MLFQHKRFVDGGLIYLKRRLNFDFEGATVAEEINNESTN